MISSEVQRTLVKSPPELWAELSDPAALARHLGELGEIRIVRTEPEKTVEWTAENTTGTVSIQPSGWGTRVTLSVNRELAEQALEPEVAAEAETEAPAVAEPTTADAEPAADALPAAIEPEPMEPGLKEPEPPAIAEPDPTPTAESEPEATAEPEPASAPAAEPRRGFFARLFGRRRHEEREEPSQDAMAATEPIDQPVRETPVERAPGQPDAFAAVREALAQESFADVHPFASPAAVNPAPLAPAASEPEPDSPAEQKDDIAAELLAAEEVAAEQVTAVLAGVLDRLGAAHHRPFSRA